MNKFINRNKKWLMAIGMVILLITFLAPAGFNELTQRFGAGNAVIAYVGETPIHASEWSEVQDDIRVVQALASTNRVPTGIFDNGKPDFAQWYLLYRQAKELNFETPCILAPDAVNTLASQMGQDSRIVDRVIGKFNSIGRMVGGYSNAVHLSDQRLKAFAQRQYFEADVDALVVQAVDRPDAPFPTEPEITDQFNKFANVKPGEGEHGFGYMLPNRAKLEWLTFNADEIKEKLRQSPQFSSTAQRKHWEKFVEERHFPDLPAEGVYAPVPDDVKDDLLSTLVQDRLAEIAKFAADRLRLDRRGLKENAGTVILPADWEANRLRFSDLAQAVQQEYALLPTYTSTGADWKTMDQIRDLPGIGAATTMKFGKTAMDLASLVNAAREFDPESPIAIQKGIEGPILNDRPGNLYLFRILDADPARAPHDAAEVRLQVIADIRKVMEYHSLVTQIPAFERRAQHEGLLSLGLQRGVPVNRSNVYLQNPDLVIRFFQQYPGFDFGANLPDPIGAHKETVGAIIDKVLAIPDVTTTADLSTLPPEETTFIIPVEDKLSVIMVHLLKVSPLTSDKYAQLVDSGAAQTAFRRNVLDAEDAMKNTFSLDALTKRYNFRLVKSDTEDSASKPAPKSNANPAQAPKL